MDAAAIDPILVSTLDDARLSRSERRQLKEQLHDLSLDDSGVSFVRHRAFALAKAHLEAHKEDSLSVVGWLEEVAKTLAAFQTGLGPAASGESSVYFSPGEDCLRQLLRLISTAKKSVDVCVFTITDDRITDALIDANKRAEVSMRIVTDNDKSFDRGSDVKKLLKAGVSLRMDRTEHHMHHKFALFDGQSVATGSYNWTRSAARFNRENIAVTNEPTLVRGYQGAFEQLWSDLA